MPHTTCIGSRPAAFLAAVALLLGPVSALQAGEAGIPVLRVEQPWARATPGGAKVGVAYLILRNDGEVADRLTGIRSDAAGRIAPHTMSMTDGIMQMRALAGLEVPPHASVTLRPGGDHLMLEDLTRPLKQGEHFGATLTFEKAGDIAVTFTVEGIAAQGPAATSEP